MIIWMDTETGGTDPSQHSILSAYYAITDHKLNIVEELDFPFIGLSHYRVTPEALRINKIDLKQKPSHFLGSAIPLLENLVSRHMNPLRITPAGHNVDFDIRFSHQILPNFGDYLNHRKIDTSVIGRFLRDCGKIPEEVSGLEGYCKFFKIKPPGLFHTAKADTLSTIEVYRAMKEVVTDAIKRT